MFKKVFLVLIILLFGMGGYFYIFPVYPDYGITEEYFHTRFHEEGFDSPENGFFEFKDTLNILVKENEASSIRGPESKNIIKKFDSYSSCFILEKCFGDLEKLSEQEKEVFLDTLINESGEFDEFSEIVNTFIPRLLKLTEDYDYISTLRFTPNFEGEIIVGGELIHYVHLISFIRGLHFYVHYMGDVEMSKITDVYKILSWLSYNMDSDVVPSLMITTLLHVHFSHVEKYYQGFPLVVKNILRNTYKNYSISDNMLENSIKANHLYGEKIFNDLYYGTINNANSEAKTSFKSLFFFDLKDSINLMRKIDADKMEGNCDTLEIKVNGKNYLGRSLLVGKNLCENSPVKLQLDKQKKVLQKREELIRLLSN